MYGLGVCDYDVISQYFTAIRHFYGTRCVLQYKGFHIQSVFWWKPLFILLFNVKKGYYLTPYDCCHVVLLQWWCCGVDKQGLTVMLRRTPGTKLWPFWSSISTAARANNIKYQSHCQNEVYYRKGKTVQVQISYVVSYIINNPVVNKIRHLLAFSNKREVVCHISTKFHPDLHFPKHIAAYRL